MKSPKKNAEKIKEKYPFNGVDFCDDVIDILVEYNDSIKDIKEQSDTESLNFEKKLKFWLETKVQIEKLYNNNGN